MIYVEDICSNGVWIENSSKKENKKGENKSGNKNPNFKEANQRLNKAELRGKKQKESVKSE